LIEQAIHASTIPAAQTLMIGDDLRDLIAASDAGIAAALVLTGKIGANKKELPGGSFPVFLDLVSFVRTASAQGVL
jgi:phosphoglycolate phosphatase-like HAD superfamily hydrolase